MAPRLTTRVELVLIDGTEISTRSHLFMCTADRVAFERHYKTSSASMRSIADLFDEEGQPREGADLGALREEWILFFAWRVLVRESADVERDFQAFIESVAECNVSDGAPEPDRVDPTMASASPTA